MRVALVAGAVLVGGLAGCGDDGAGDPDAGGLDGPPADARDCRVEAAAGTDFGPAVTVSDPGNGSFVPAVAARDGRVVIAWHDFPAGGGPSRVVTTTIVDGCAGPLEVLAETLDGPKRPALVATASGFVLAWEAGDAGTTVIRTVDLDGDGHAIAAPVTVSAAGAAGYMPEVAAYGDDVVWTWTDVTAHHFARRGPVETVPATPIGSTLQSTGLLNFPRVAVMSTGAIVVAYRDGGVDAIDWEVLLMLRQVGGAFLGPIDVSRSSQLLSDDIALAVEADDTLDVVWVDQDPIDVNSFEVTYATRTPAGFVGLPARYATQGQWAWTPATVPGLASVWHTGAGQGGDLWFAPGPGAPQVILPGEQGAAPALARSGDGALHLAFVTPGTPRQVRYAWRR